MILPKVDFLLALFFVIFRVIEVVLLCHVFGLANQLVSGYILYRY